MKINVEMTPEEYDDYRAYQKEKKTLEDKAYAVVNSLRSECNELCTQILKGLAIRDFGGRRTVGVVDSDAAMRAVVIATDWFS